MMNLTVPELLRHVQARHVQALVLSREDRRHLDEIVAPAQPVRPSLNPIAVLPPVRRGQP